MGMIWRTLGLLGLVPALVSAGPLTRVANTSLQLPAFPVTLNLATTNAFPGLTFDKPVALATPAGETNRLFIVEQTGRIQVITNLAAPTKSLFLDLSDRVSFTINGEEGLLGLAFHPGFATNGWFFVFYTTWTNQTEAFNSRHDRLSRFQMSTGNPQLADAASEIMLLNQRDEGPNHNAGDLKFGPDGYLYVSVGDEGGQNDSFGNSQRIDGDFFSGILRLDVDQRPGSLAPNPHPASLGNYAIPSDNPFVGATTFNGMAVNPAAVRTEFWAVGLRNPWRIWIDPPTGWLFASDTGESTRDEINFITKGGNHGWAYREGIGPRPGAGSPPSGFFAVNPIHDHPWGTAGTGVGKAIIGGLLYRGGRYPAIANAYVFGDYLTGNLWALDFDGVNATNFRHLATDFGVTSFGLDPATGELLFTDQIENRVKRFVHGTNVLGSELPASLSATGAFTDLVSLTPAAGIVPYDLNVAFWSDQAHKTRWFSVPATNAFITFHPDDNWSFPAGAVWIKTFELELTNGVPASRRRLETRFLVRNAEGVHGVTYRWNDAQTEALLVDGQGLDESFVIHGGGTTRTQTWHYPGRGECLQCHTAAGGLALGFNTAQLNRDFDYGGTITNQLRALFDAGYFGNTISNFHVLPRLSAATNETVSLAHRVRSYLAANCAHCHQPDAPGGGAWDARLRPPFSALNILHGPLVRPGTNANERIIVPDSLADSRLYLRLLTNDASRMPPLATSMLDTNSSALVARWITNSLVTHQTFAQWQTQQFGGTNLAIASATADPDADGAPNFLEYLTGTLPLQSGDGFRLELRRATSADLSFPQRAGVGYEIQWTDNPGDHAVWLPLDVPANAPFFAPTNRTMTVPDDTGNEPKRFYRVRVFEP